MEAHGRPLVLALVAVATGCAGEPGRRAHGADDAASLSAEARPDPAVELPEARPRLRHTVTLGESIGGEAPGATEGAPATDGPWTGDGVNGPSHGAWGYDMPGALGSPGWDEGIWYPGWYGIVPADPPVRRPPSTRPWTPPPEYGPRFPFKTAPADPWR